MTTHESTNRAVTAPDHGARGHHRFGMSKLNYIDPEVGGCRGYDSRSGTSKAAEEGTELHEVSERILREYLRSARPGVTLAAFAAARRDWDDESDKLLRQCFTFLDEHVLRPGARVFIELKARVRRGDGTEVNYGHLDLFVIWRDGSAKLVDWKFGSVPVLPAPMNRQGMGYAAAMFQQFPDVRSIESIFVQPRLRWVTRHTFPRPQAAELAYRVDRLIQEAIAVQSEQPMDPAKLNPGSACEWCSRVGECAGYNRTYGSAVMRLGGLPLPTTFNVDSIDTPERAAIAKAWIDFLELAAAPIKEKAEAFARANGGAIEATLEDGTSVRYEMASRSVARELGSAPEIADVLQDFIDPRQLLAAAKLGLEKTLELAAPALMEVNPEVGTKKAAREAILALLEAHGLVSRPDGKVEFLKRAKTKALTKTK